VAPWQPRDVMRIAYVIPAYPPLASQPFVVNEMIAVQEAGHEVVVLPLYAGERGGVHHGTFARFRPVAVLAPALCDARTAAVALGVLLRHPWRAARTLAGLHWAAGTSLWSHLRLVAVTPKALAGGWRLRRLGVERIHAHFANQTADCAAIAAGVAVLPFSFTAHAYDIYSTAPRQRNATLDWKLRHAARIFAVSRYARDLLRGRLSAADHGRVWTAYVGIPTALFRLEPQPADASGLRLLCVARFQEKKGLDTLIDACALLRDRGVRFHLRLIGDGPQRDELRAQVTRLALDGQVELPGPMPQEDVAQALRDCHVFVMPCRRDRTGDMDGIPTVFMEALASGRPVVSCAVSGVPELVRDGETGLLVPPDAPASLADAVQRLAADPALRARLGSAGRILVERQHDQDRNARRVVELLAGGAESAVDAARSPVLTPLEESPQARSRRSGMAGTVPLEAPRPGAVLSRALRLRCPRCGHGRLYDGWLSMQERCPACGLVYEREQGYFVGAMYVNYALTAALGLGGVILLDQLIGLSLTQQLLLAVPVMLLAPVLFFRHARSFWLGLEYFVSSLDQRSMRRGRRRSG